MSENYQKNRGRPKSYQFDRGGAPTEFGPYIGIVRNNVDPTRSGRVQVYIEAFAGPDQTDSTLWRTVSYASPFFGITPNTSSDTGAGTFVGNRHSYGMWFTPPDIGTRVLCVFPEGKPDEGFYIGCIVESGLSHMVPAVGATTEFITEGDGQSQFFGNSAQLPGVEVNDSDPDIFENPRFFDQPRPIHASQATVFFQQGLIDDPIRGPIRSSSQRESPSRVYGVSTPGRPIYQGGYDDTELKTKLEKNEIKLQDVSVLARRGGHSFVMDDGDINGSDNLVRIRTAKGHQITMSDNGDCFYISHANGQTWIELGKEGTVDIFSTNSVNVRTQGTINLHADKDININAGGSIIMKAKDKIQTQATDIETKAFENLYFHCDSEISVRSDGTLALEAKASASVNGGGQLDLNAGSVGLNSRGSLSTNEIDKLVENEFPDVFFDKTSGWSSTKTVTSVATRVTTHEPYAAHNLGVDVDVNLTNEPADAQTTPAGWDVARVK